MTGPKSGAGRRRKGNATLARELTRGDIDLPDLQRRFEAKISVDSNGCWIWTAYTCPYGYGQIGIGRRIVRSHRASWLIYRGDIPAGDLVLHHCDVRACVNPSHLYLGTALDNRRDAFERGRERHAFGEESGQCRLSSQEVNEIRRRYVRRFAARSQSGGWRSNARELGAEFGVSAQYVGQLVKLKWRVLG